MLQSKNSTATKYFLLLFILVIFGLTACDDGDDGRDGQPGPPGPAGPPAGVDPGNAGEIIADITNVSIASPPVVDFTLSDENGNPVVGLPASSISFTIAKLVPGTDGNASAWQSYINRTEDPGGVGPGTETEIQAATENGGDGVLDEITNGIYQYTFATDVANVTDPIAVSASSDNTWLRESCNRSFNSAAPPPPIDQGCFPNRSRDESSTLTNSLCDPGWSICSTIADHTKPRDGSSGVLGSPRMPITVRIVSEADLRCRPNRITVGVP